MIIRVAVADDHPAMLAGMEQLLSGWPEIEIAGLAPDPSALVDLLGRTTCDVVVTDFSMPGGRHGDGLSLLQFLQRRFPQIRIVVLTGVESVSILRSILDVGVTVVVSKSDDYGLIETAIRRAYQRLGFLSPEVRRVLDAASTPTDQAVSALSKREMEVLRLFAEGLTVIQISQRIERSRKTVSTQKVAAMKKLGLDNDAELFAYAISHGLVTASQSARDKAADQDETP